MEQTDTVFNGTRDRYKGITVSTASERFEIEKFPIKLQSMNESEVGARMCDDFVLFLESLEHWKERQCRTVWFKVDVGNSDVVPILAKVTFQLIKLWKW